MKVQHTFVLLNVKTHEGLMQVCVWNSKTDEGLMEVWCETKYS